MSKLKNIHAIRQMLDGTHRTQTRTVMGFTDASATAERNKKREDGEVWEEKDFNGNIQYWEQKGGIRVLSHYPPALQKVFREIQDYSRSFPNCQKVTCTCKAPNRIDERFRKLAGMCEDCLITYETRLKIRGEFNEYAINKMKTNAEAFFRDADKEVELIKEQLKEVSFVENGEGGVEKWEHTNLDGLLKNIDEEYNKFKERTMKQFEGK